MVSWGISAQTWIRTSVSSRTISAETCTQEMCWRPVCRSGVSDHPVPAYAEQYTVILLLAGEVMLRLDSLNLQEHQG